MASLPFFGVAKIVSADVYFSPAVLVEVGLLETLVIVTSNIGVVFAEAALIVPEIIIYQTQRTLPWQHADFVTNLIMFMVDLGDIIVG